MKTYLYIHTNNCRTASALFNFLVWGTRRTELDTKLKGGQPNSAIDFFPQMSYLETSLPHSSQRGCNNTCICLSISLVYQQEKNAFHMHIATLLTAQLQLFYRIFITFSGIFNYSNHTGLIPHTVIFSELRVEEGIAIS